MFLIDRFLHHELDSFRVANFRLVCNCLDSFIISVLNLVGLSLELRTLLLSHLHDLVENLIGSSPLQPEPLFLQKITLYIVDAELLDSLFIVGFIFAIEGRVVFLAVLKFLPETNTYKLTHF